MGLTETTYHIPGHTKPYCPPYCSRCSPNEVLDEKMRLNHGIWRYTLFETIDWSVDSIKTLQNIHHIVSIHKLDNHEHEP
jgi:hypothetical protein